jgi:hypothetical protein
MPKGESIAPVRTALSNYEAGRAASRNLRVLLSREEQRRRLQDRLDDPEKRWKFRLGDLDDRKLWDDFAATYEEALHKTSTARLRTTARRVASAQEISVSADS